MKRSGPLIICGAVYASRNPFKALSIHENHNECVFLRTFSSFRVSCYQIVLSRSYYNKEPEQRCMTDHRIKNNPLSSFENKQRNFSNISYMVLQYMWSL
jgi:hypothetical protein